MSFKLFGGYNTPGPGVRKDEPQKPPFVRFWQLFFRKFTKLVQLNLIYIVPLIIICALIVMINIFLRIQQPLLFMIPIIFISPFNAGLTYVTRNFAREEHAFVYSDFKETVIKNWKPFLINGIVCYLFTMIMFIAIQYYWKMSTINIMYTVALGICIMISCLFIFSQYYVPVLIITFDLKLKQIYKNSSIFAILGLWRNLMLTIIFAVLFVALYISFNLMPLTILIAMLLLVFILFAFCSYMVNFTVYPLIVKMMIKPYYDKQNSAERSNEDKGSEKPEQQPDDTKAETNDQSSDNKDEYVFVNGKLIKRPLNEDDNNIFNDRT